MNLNWAKNFTGNVKIVFYDDLVNNVESVLRSILDFLEFPIDEVTKIQYIAIKLHTLIYFPSPNDSSIYSSVR